jgi:hypothetical protein
MNKFFVTPTAGSIGADNIIEEINANGTTAISGASVESSLVSILLTTSEGHCHHVFLSTTEASNLMKRIVSSVVKTSSTDSSHSHSVTITYNSANNMFEASVVSGGSPAHTHFAIPQPQTAILPIFLSATGLATPHTHTAFLTQQEAHSLMQGTIASVVKTSSANSTGTAHTHIVTITWDSTNLTFKATSSTDLLHTHGNIVSGPQSVFGTYFQIVHSESESTTSASAFQTKATLTTPSLPLGNYLFFWTFGTNNSGGKAVSIEVRLNSSRVRLIEFRPGSGATTGQYEDSSGFHHATNISGVQVFDLRFRSPEGDTTRIGDVHLMVYRAS